MSEPLDVESRPDTGSSLDGRLRWLVLAGPPILLGAMFLIHPDGSGGFESLLPISESWLVLHVAMLPVLGLLGVSLYVLLADYSGTVATVGRVGIAIYVTFYVAFEAIAGIVTGVLAHEAHTLPPEQQEGIAAAIDALVGPSVALAIVGTVGALVAVVAYGVLRRRSGAPLGPVLLLGGLPLALVFHGGTPLDAIGMVAFLVGLGWLEYRGYRTSDHRSPGGSDASHDAE
ncbi:hypothetical protein [Natronobacterium texcoconense]|uniref:DUF4386 family protein n=1 Tax=Natronobacterium texcoconense TaxID=1095778 RepID=A0A1H1EQ68_NATTX|nr:hypothetical protein [Natronobacterium texcoconense]SDQ90246.1 hypothetical protein SAMN04489842_1641 [Natronobacterium texcoconense]